MELTTTFASDLKLRLGDDGRLFLETEEGEVPVSLTECFPWTRPGAFVSLRDGKNEERALVRAVEDLPEASRAALRAALDVAGFVFVIEQIEAIEKDFELRRWIVRTRQGPRRFVTKLEDWPRVLDDGRILIEDLAGDTYVVPDRTQLDTKSQEWLWAYAG